MEGHSHSASMPAALEPSSQMTVNALSAAQDFFSQAGFMPHGHCYLWKPPLVWTHVLSDLLIGLAYFSISIILYLLIRKIRIPFSVVVLSFGVFIGACGLTHFLEIWTLWYPDYWLSGGVKVLTAFASVGTGVYLFKLRQPIITVAEAAKLSQQRQLDLEALTRDLEDRVAERTRELEQSRSELLELTNALPSLVSYIDCDLHLRLINETFESWYGVKAENTIGQPLESVMEPSSFKRIKPYLLRACQGERIKFEIEVLYPTVGRKYVQAHYVPRFNGGKVQGIFTLVIDQTREQENKLRIQALAEQSERDRLQAQAASEAKSRFLANMSHELRTPMTAVLGFTELLKDGAIPESDKSDALERIDRNARSLLRLIDDILDISKIEAGKVVVHKVSFSPQEVVKEVISLFLLQAEKKGTKIATLLSSSVPDLIYSDPVRLRQILTNLIGNAVKFTDGGEILISVSTKISPQDDKQFIIFEIRDSGIGIAQKDQAKLFQPFAQADESITRQFGGTGLGLVLSKRLAEQLGGDIELMTSRPGRGSCFEVKIEGGPFNSFTSPRETQPLRNQ